MEYSDSKIRSTQGQEVMKQALMRRYVDNMSPEERAALDDRLREAAGRRRAWAKQEVETAVSELETRDGSPDEGSAPSTSEPKQELKETREKGSSEGSEREVEVNAPATEHTALLYGAGRTKPEFNKPLPKDASFADLLEVPASQRKLNMGRYLRGALTGNWHGAEREQRSMSGLTSGAGGALLPTVFAAQLVDLARVRTQVLNAGAQVIPMSERKLTLPKWVSDPSVQWRLEEAAVAESAGTVGTVNLVAKSLAGYTKLSREILSDTDLGDILVNAYASAVAQAFDYAALKGSGTDPTPLGLSANTNITNKAAVVTNGATLTWEHVLDAVGSVRTLNEEPNAVIYHPRNELALGKAKDTAGQYLDVPRYVSGIQRLATGTLPTNETEGTSGAVCNSMFIGDFSQLMLGVRSQFEVELHPGPLATNGQVLLVIHFRGDVAVGRESAFAVRTGLKA